MDKYNPESKCIKCGNDNISSRFIAEGTWYSIDDKGHTKRSHAERDMIERHCRNCHYEWQERPLDESKETPNG